MTRKQIQAKLVKSLIESSLDTNVTRALTVTMMRGMQDVIIDTLISAGVDSFTAVDMSENIIDRIGCVLPIYEVHGENLKIRFCD